MQFKIIVLILNIRHISSEIQKVKHGKKLWWAKKSKSKNSNENNEVDFILIKYQQKKIMKFLFICEWHILR